MSPEPIPPRSHTIISTVFVAASAFLLASFPARNADLLGHLAAGRNLVHGTGSAAPVVGPERIGTTWLYDLVSYGIYSLAGGAGLGLVKALLVAGVGLILFRLSRTGPGVWVPAACTALALLTMGTRLLLQPVTVSYLLLAVALWVVLRRDRGRPGWLPPLALAAVFVVWANVDSRFVIGLAVVALVWLGRAIDGGRLAELPRYAVALVVLAAACLANPAHVGAFGLPPELDRGGLVTSSPFRRAYLTTLGLSPAGLAYFPLLGLGLLSFALTRGGLRWERLLPWIGLAVLSAVQVRAAPFFAVVAGPVLAWNLHDRYTRRAAAPGGWAGVSRRLAAVAGVALVVCAWPGWLQAPPYEPRRWAVEVPPGLTEGAAAVDRWYEGPTLRSGRCLFLSPDAAAAFAWLCPREIGVYDDRLAAAVGDPDGADDWAGRMRAAGIDRVIAYHPDRGRLYTVLGRLFADPDQWPLLLVEGDLAVFGWRDPTRSGSAELFRGREIDPDRLAFAEGRVERAPPGQPANVGPREWWEAFWKPAPPRSADRDEAAVHLFHAGVRRQSAPVRHLEAWEAGQAAALVAAAAAPGGLTDAPVRLAVLRPPLPEEARDDERLPLVTRYALAGQRVFTRRRDDEPPALLYLAVRAARRATAAGPADAQAHLLLGEAYLRLIDGTRERAWGGVVPELIHLRGAQATAALSRAVALQPDLAPAHYYLGALFRDAGYFDLALKHMRTHGELVRAAGPPPGATAEQFRVLLERAGQDLDRLERRVAEQEKAFAAESAGARVLDRARLAARLGLPGKALETLLASDVAAFGPAGMELELELLLRTGRAADVRRLLSAELQSEHVAALGEAPYRWLRVQALAAVGEYAAARDEFAALSAARESPGRLRGAINLTVGQAVLDGRPPGDTWPDMWGRTLGGYEFLNRLQAITRGMRQTAEATTFRGLIALEEGDVGAARAAFRAALGEAPDAIGAGMRFSTRVIARDCLAWIQ